MTEAQQTDIIPSHLITTCFSIWQTLQIVINTLRPLEGKAILAQIVELVMHRI